MNSNVDIGLSHADLGQQKNCQVNIGKASVRNTDMMFVYNRDPDIHIEVGEPNVFKVSNKGIPISHQLTRIQGSNGTGNSDWMTVKSADENMKELIRLKQRQNDIIELKNFDMHTDVRNPAFEYKQSYPFNFNLLKISDHQQKLKLACDLFKTQVKQTAL